ncbi:retrovirus-related pol polyprotein from transposon TNT 1-94 [Tanacetum coccineum]
MVLTFVTKQDLLPKVVDNNQLDIQNAFLHGNLKEQVPHAWFERLFKALFDLGFKGSKTDPSLFIYSRGDTLLYILIYVDDIIVTGNNKGTINNIICQLGSAFALKDLRPLNYFLGIEIVPHMPGILLSQKKYILELLQSVGLSNCNPVSSPMVTSSSLSLDDSTAFSNLVKYRQVVGSLQYVTLSRPNIAFAVNKVCQYMHAPIENHWSAVKRILRYLHGTFEHGMLIRHSSGSTLQPFIDVLWKGAEYKALADTIDELTWLQALLHELGIRSSSTPILWCDDLGATYLSANPIFRARTKHVEIDYHFVREKVDPGDLRVQHISTHDQIADIFTKPLPTPRFLADTKPPFLDWKIVFIKQAQPHLLLKGDSSDMAKISRKVPTSNLVRKVQERQSMSIEKSAKRTAKRVAEKMEIELGVLGGYAIRFEDVTGHNGVLLRETLKDANRNNYGQGPPNKFTWYKNKALHSQIVAYSDQTRPGLTFVSTSWHHPWDLTLEITLRKMSAMANTTPIVTTVTKSTVREKTPKDAVVIPRVNIQDFCKEHYEDILPVIMDKIRREKRKEVHARLDFEESPTKKRIREGQIPAIILAVGATLMGGALLAETVLGAGTALAASKNHTIIPAPSTGREPNMDTAPAT